MTAIRGSWQLPLDGLPSPLRPLVNVLVWTHEKDDANALPVYTVVDRSICTASFQGELKCAHATKAALERMSQFRDLFKAQNFSDCMRFTVFQVFEVFRRPWENLDLKSALIHSSDRFRAPLHTFGDFACARLDTPVRHAPRVHQRG